MPQLYSLIGMAIIFLAVIFAGLGWAGRFRYHREFPKDSWQSTELARAHTIMYFGIMVCVAFPLSSNHLAWIATVAAGLLIEIVGVAFLIIYSRKMRKMRRTQPTA